MLTLYVLLYFQITLKGDSLSKRFMNTPFVTLAEIDTLDRKVLLKRCFKGPGTIGQIFPKPLSSGIKKIYTIHLERQKKNISGQKESSNPIFPTMLILNDLFLTPSDFFLRLGSPFTHRVRDNRSYRSKAHEPLICCYCPECPYRRYLTYQPNQ